MKEGNDELEPAKSLLTILATLAGVVGVLLALREYSDSIEQRRVENKINILHEFSPALSLVSLKSEGLMNLPEVEIVVQNEILYPISITINGANAFDCDGLATPIVLGRPVSLKPISRFTVMSRSTTTITMTADFVSSDIPSDFVDRLLSEKPELLEPPPMVAVEQSVKVDDATTAISIPVKPYDTRPFIVEFVFTASVFNVDDFSKMISESGMETGNRMSVGRIADSSPFSWVYRFRRAYIDNGFAFEEYHGAECVLPGNSDTDVAM